MYRVTTLLLIFLVTSTTLPAATLSMSDPVNNLITSKESILFKGNTQDIHSLTINDINIPIQNNSFYSKFKLNHIENYNSFTLLAHTTSGTTITLNRKKIKNIPQRIPLRSWHSDV